MLRAIFLTILAVGLFQISQAQHQRGIKIAFGPGVINHNETFPVGEYTNLSSLSLQMGFYNEWKLKERLKFGGEVLVTYVRGKSHLEFPVFKDNGDLFGQYEQYSLRDMIYLSVPMWCGVEFGRWTVNAGIQGSVFLTGYYQRVQNFQIPGTVSVWPGNNRLNGANRIDFGPRAAVFCRINNRWSMEASYYHGLTNAYRWEVGTKSNIQQGTLGARIAIL